MIEYDPIKFKTGLAAALCSPYRAFYKCKQVVLEVEKIVSNTYAASTTYADEEFILMDIYPKTNGTVSVSYGGLTKTITDTSGAEKPNAQQVFFGIFNGVADDVTTPENGILTIQGDYETFSVGAFSYDDKETKPCGCITNVVQFGNMTSICEYAFEGCNSLHSITIPRSITNIGVAAFKSCNYLENILVDKNNLFYSNDDTGVLFNKDRTRLLAAPGTIYGNYAVPDSVISIDNYAFYDCSALTSISISNAYNNVTHIGSRSFQNCTNLTNVTINSGIGDIGEHAFRSCTALAEFAVSDTGMYGTATSIGERAFQACSALTEFTIPDTVTSIGDYTFYSCSALADVVISSSVTSIGLNALSQCSALSSVTFKNTSGWIVTSTRDDISAGTSVNVTNAKNNATLFKDTHSGKFWYRK